MKINNLNIEELRALTKDNDIRHWSKDKAKWYLFKSELTYLMSRGWHTLCGISDKYYVAPEEKCTNYSILYSHEEALSIQKKKDQK